MAGTSATQKLVIVESPTKAKTLTRYLDKNYQILATYGHVLDLRSKTGAVEPDKEFLMHFEPIKKNEKQLQAIVQAAKKAGELYLATDPDREGEAISADVYQFLKDKKAVKGEVHRVVFHEITKKAILDAFLKPRELAIDLIEAQRARRALDYLVGYNLSPLLWRKVRPGLSAGRVQSPALRLIVEREEEIARFQVQEYWTVTADLSEAKNKKPPFQSRLITYQNEKLSQFSLTEEKQVQEIVEELKRSADGQLTVTNIEKKQRKRNPAAPFITSTMQQEAARKLGFSAQKTMQIAQQLYEGIDIGEGAQGLITYMRTDSVNLAQDAINSIRDYISTHYGKESLPDSPRAYKTKAKNAQEAHEAIRPTTVELEPKKIKAKLSPDQFKLYELIWKRTVACQMNAAVYDMVRVDLSCGEGNTFRANGSTLVIPGFLEVYQEGIDDRQNNATEDNDEDANTLPVLEVGQKVHLLDMQGNQHFTEPPPRYTEASLIKALEEFGIGRPSTYASIIATLKKREYVILDQKRFKPTDVGVVVNKFLTNYFKQYVDYDFTAHLEDSLDEVSRGEKKWIPLLEEFWQPFIAQIENTAENVQRKDVTQEKLDEKCPTCGGELVSRLGKRGKFVGCSNYPECNYTRSMDQEPGESSEPEVVQDRKCPDCAQDLVIKMGRYGKFIGCSQYPNCKHIEPLEKPLDTKVECAECHQGTMLKRKSRYGKYFYSCNTYPKCKYAVWNEPLAETCPKCQWPVLTIKTTKRRGTEKVCPQKECAYAVPVE